MAPIIMIKIRASMTAYSTAAVPSVSRRKVQTASIGDLLERASDGS
jgi:hypothetical protein